MTVFRDRPCLASILPNHFDNRSGDGGLTSKRVPLLLLLLLLERDRLEGKKDEAVRLVRSRGRGTMSKLEPLGCSGRGNRFCHRDQTVDGGSSWSKEVSSGERVVVVVSSSTSLRPVLCIGMGLLAREGESGRMAVVVVVASTAVICRSWPLSCNVRRPKRLSWGRSELLLALVQFRRMNPKIRVASVKAFMLSDARNNSR